MPVTDLFRALGDPYRLEMVKRVSKGGYNTINTLSQGLDISRQGARKHLQILVDSNLIILETKGRETTVHLNRKELKKGSTFLQELEKKWDLRLEALRRTLENE